MYLIADRCENDRNIIAQVRKGAIRTEKSKNKGNLKWEIIVYR